MKARKSSATSKSKKKTITKSKEPGNFKAVLKRAKEDEAYAKKLRLIGEKARSGDPKALEEFVAAFKMTPKTLQELLPATSGPQFFASTLPCTVVITTTFLSCFPHTSIGYHWFCKEAR